VLRPCVAEWLTWGHSIQQKADTFNYQFTATLQPCEFDGSNRIPSADAIRPMIVSSPRACAKWPTLHILASVKLHNNNPVIPITWCHNAKSNNSCAYIWLPYFSSILVSLTLSFSTANKKLSCCCDSQSYCLRRTAYWQTITGWAVAQTCCISQCAKYRKSEIFGYPWEQNPWTDRHETWGA